MLIGRYTAFLDANVLHPAFLRTALLNFASERLFIPTWSAEVLAEWRRSLQRRYPDMSEVQLERLSTAMNAPFPEAMIEGFDALTPCTKLPDANDNHVLAAAIVGRCNGIVTANTKHFPPAIASPYQLEIVHPDDFVVNIIDLDPGRALAACAKHRASLKNPAMSATDFLDRYRSTGLIQSHERLMPHVELI